MADSASIIKKPVILIVDDDEDLRETIAMEFELFGFDVRQAENGKIAFEKVENSKDVNLIISDIRMPGGNGIELLKRVQNSGLPIKVILISGFMEVNSKLADETKGAYSILSKPFARKDLLSKVSLALNELGFQDVALEGSA